jgi:hypothetical protein
VRSQGFLDYPSNCFRKHVFEDLKPYVCTIDKCEEPRILYNHSAMWAEHESSHAVPSTAECPFCGANFQQRALAYFKHVAAHLQEVSLSVLPHPADEDDGLDSEDSNNEDNSSIFEPSLTENIQNDSPMGQKESLSQSEQVQILPDLADDAGPSDHGHNQTSSPSTQAAVKSSNELDIDKIINRLLEVRGSGPGKQVRLLEREIRYLYTKAKEVLISQPTLLELEPPVKVINQIRSDLDVLLAYFARFVEIFMANIMIF